MCYCISLFLPQTIVELTHIARLWFDLMSNANPQKGFFVQAFKFCLENARRRNSRYDISEYPYDNPLEYIKQYAHFFKGDNLIKMQEVNECYMKLHKTQQSENLSKLFLELFQNRKWFEYLLKFFKWVAANFPSPFKLEILGILKPNNTYEKWISNLNQCQHSIINNGKKSTILFPGLPAPATVYRLLQSACYLSSEYNVSNYCYQSKRQASNALVNYHLLSIHDVFLCTQPTFIYTQLA